MLNEYHNFLSSKRVFLVTLTYSNRFHLLNSVVYAALDNGAYKVVIIDNGSSDESKRQIESLKSKFNDIIFVKYLGENTGSAKGFSEGIKYASEHPECDYIWLLDDDNQPKPNALLEIVEQYEILSQFYPQNKLALLSLREDRYSHVKLAKGESPDNLYAWKSSFLGIHLFQVLKKVIIRFINKINTESYNSIGTISKKYIQIPFGPYGGLFFHKNVIPDIGFPNEQFFVYADDIEFSNRISTSGGKLFLIPSSILQDIDSSWHIQTQGSNILSKALLADSNFRIYYALRNQVFFEKNFFTNSKAIFYLNKWFVLAILWFLSQKYHKHERFQLIKKAIQNGEQGNLGKVKEFSL